jgi:prepilin signal peptidase PulO-like enzyme (type II secretory pathway)
MDFIVAIFYILLIIVGSIIGYFLKTMINRLAAINRLPHEEGHSASTWKQYPLIELATALLFMLSWHTSNSMVEAAIKAVLCAILVCVFIIDLKTQTIPDGLWIALAVLGIVRVILGYAGILDPAYSITILDAAIGAFATSLPLFAIALATSGFGGGDVKLMFGAGIFLGWQHVLFAFLIGTTLGGIIAIILLLTKKATRKTKIAFGPYLAIGIGIAAFWGESITSAYFSLF